MKKDHTSLMVAGFAGVVAALMFNRYAQGPTAEAGVIVASLAAALAFGAFIYLEIRALQRAQRDE